MLRSLVVSLVLLAALSVHADEVWEGEFQTQRWPTFIRLTLGESPSLAVLGRNVPITDVRRDNATLTVTAGTSVISGAVAGNQWTGTVTSGAEVFPVALTRVPDYPATTDRVARWSQDLDALAERFLRYDRSFSAGEKAQFLEQIELLRSDLPNVDDATVMMRIASAIALGHNAHSRLYLLRNRTEMRRLPIRVWWFRDALYVVRTTPEYAKLLGCRVDDFGGMLARHARDLVAPAFAGNSSWKDYMSAYSLTSPDALRGVGIIKGDSVDLGLSACGAKPFRATIEPLPLLKKSKATEAWWDLSPRYDDPDRKWLHVLGEKTALPFYLQNPNSNYAFECLADSGLLYFQYNRAADAASSETMAQFGERLLSQFALHPVKGFVVDLRFNTGGDLGVARELMNQLQEKTRSMPRWVITGRNTFSAGISPVAMWRSYPDVKIAGEPVGDELDFWAEGGNIVLPNSGLYAHFANGAHSYSAAPCPKDTYCYDLNSPPLTPDLPASVSWDEYRAGIDPAMKAILDQFRASTKPFVAPSE